MIKLVILDLDGVVYIGNKLIPSADKVIEKLKKNGITVVYLTNSCTRSRRARAEKLHELGIRANEYEIYATSYALAKYISENYPKSKQNIFYIGGNGIEEELTKKGIAVVPAEKANIVVVGLDRSVTYSKFTTAFNAIMHGADFIATNIDQTFPVENGLMPGAGALVNFLSYATGKKPKVIGKPETYMLEMIAKELGISKNEMLIVGDRIETDIALGKKVGAKTALVLSGVSKKEDLEKLKNSEIPDYVLDSIADLATYFNPQSNP